MAIVIGKKRWTNGPVSVLGGFPTSPYELIVLYQWPGQPGVDRTATCSIGHEGTCLRSDDINIGT